MGESVPCPLKARKTVWPRNRHHVKSAAVILVGRVTANEALGGADDPLLLVNVD